MSLSHSPRIVTNGIIHILDASKYNTSLSQTITSPIGDSWTISNFSTGNTSSIISLSSNVNNFGAGNSFVRVAPNSSANTGSITFILWFNLKNIPIDTDGNNNWRALVATNLGGTSGSPLTMVLEEARTINFSTSHTDSYRRYLDSSFTPISVDANGWQMITYTYSKDTGIAHCYKNNTAIRVGRMTSDASNNSPTAAGTGLLYTNYTSGGTQTGFRIFGGNSETANTTGNGFVPGELSNIMIYNRALSNTEISQNFNALRGRFGI